MKLNGSKAVALAAALLVVASVGSALADFTAYNDCYWVSGEIRDTTKVTNFEIGQSGTLKDYANGGADTGVTVSTSGNVDRQPSIGGDCAVGTDAYNVFHGIVDLASVYWTGATGPSITISFSGLNPNSLYEFVTTTNRAGGYTTRTSTFTIDGADSCVNASTPGTTGGGVSTTFVTGENTANGYVARWTNIVSGSDGAFSVTGIRGATNDNKAYFFSAFMLKETSPVPEPGSLLALGSGLMGLAGFTARRRARK